MPQSKDLSGPAFHRLPPWVKEKLSPIGIEKIQKVYDFVENECIPAEPIMRAQIEAPENHWKSQPLRTELRRKAKAAGLFNLFLPKHFKESPGLTNLEYSCCAELMGRVYWAQEALNCHAPETGNIELLAKYCTPEQKKKWLVPLMEGTSASAYSMTEPDRASSDATQLGCRITKDGDEYVINGRKIFGNSLSNTDIKFFILMACSDPDNPNKWARHSMVIVPTDTPGITHVRNLTIMGYDHAPVGHGEFLYENVRIPKENMILGEGRAFEIAQGRLGPGRIHHCMRLIGQCERAYELALIRCIDKRKTPRGKQIGQFDSNIERIAQMRIELDQARLVVLNAADTMDIHGNKAGRYAIAQCKILIPMMAQRLIDECMQLYGGQGLTQHTPLPEMWTYARFMRVADGPDSAHRHQVGRDELKTAEGFAERNREYRRKYEKMAKEGRYEKEMFWGVTPDV